MSGVLNVCRDRIQLQPTPGRVIAAAQPLALGEPGSTPVLELAQWSNLVLSQPLLPAEPGLLAAPLNRNAMIVLVRALLSHHAAWLGTEPGASSVPGSIIQDLRRSSSCSLVRSVRCDACKRLSARCHRTHASAQES